MTKSSDGGKRSSPDLTLARRVTVTAVANVGDASRVTVTAVANVGDAREWAIMALRRLNAEPEA
jgi:hypothetical protein